MQRWFKDNRGLIAFLLLFGVFRTAIADWNPIPSGSMRPGLLEGDVVLVNRLAFDLKLPLSQIVVARMGEPQRGDVVTFKSPTDGVHTIKRIIGVPGDVVEMRNEQLIINGQPAQYELVDTVRESVAEGQLTDAMRFDEVSGAERRRVQIMPAVPARRDFRPTTVPAGQFMMLGDNRDNSADSRYFGFVPRTLLVGRAERILVSADIMGNWAPRTERFGMSLRKH